MAKNNSTRLEPHVKDEQGNVHGKLTVLEYIGSSPTRHKAAHWLCRCECGNTTLVSGSDLRSGDTTSCGCTRKSQDGKCRTPEYRIWKGMKRRCYYSSDKDYKYYGGRGITICDRWRKSFLAFYGDMGPRPFKGASIDRIDNDKGYSKDNCRWATQEQQQNNKCSSRYVTYKGKTLTVAQWARRLGLHRNILLARLNKGWSLKNALSGKKHVRCHKKNPR